MYREWSHYKEAIAVWSFCANKHANSRKQFNVTYLFFFHSLICRLLLMCLLFAKSLSES